MQNKFCIQVQTSDYDLTLQIYKIMIKILSIKMQSFKCKIYIIIINIQILLLLLSLLILNKIFKWEIQLHKIKIIIQATNKINIHQFKIKNHLKYLRDNITFKISTLMIFLIQI
jgi:hypothetical protein